MSEPLLQVEKLSVAFGRAEVVSGISFAIRRGEVLALVGESGCGKSSASLALAGLLPPAAEISAEHINFHAGQTVTDLYRLPEKQLRKIRGGKIAYVFQEPSVSLNPVMTVRSQISEVLELHRPEVSDYDREIIRLLEQVGIPDAAGRLKAYPHELSGGMQQRVMIAMALAGEPELLIADEPTTALDVTVQAQILELLHELQKQRNMAVLLISHNLGVVSALADRIAVMYAGRIVESGTVRQITGEALHPYTRALLAAVPELGREQQKLQTIPGFVPPPSEYSPNCRFAARCRFRTAECDAKLPPETEFESGHFCCCYHPGGENI